MDDATSTKLALEQPTRKRKWQLRRGDEVVAELELPSVRRGGKGRVGVREVAFEVRGLFRVEHAVTELAGGAELARVRGGKVELEGEALQWRSLGRGQGYGLQDRAGGTVLRGKVSRGLTRTTGQVEVEAGRDAGLPALLAAYLLIRKAEEDEAAAVTTVVIT
jgi:hypothetical protein